MFYRICVKATSGCIILLVTAGITIALGGPFWAAFLGGAICSDIVIGLASIEDTIRRLKEEG